MRVFVIVPELISTAGDDRKAAFVGSASGCSRIIFVLVSVPVTTALDHEASHRS